MKGSRTVLAVAGATAGIAIASIAAISVAAAPVTGPGDGARVTAPPASALCDHHTPAMDAMHQAMDQMEMVLDQMHAAMGGGMMGGGMMGGGPGMDGVHQLHHGSDAADGNAEQ